VTFALRLPEKSAEGQLSVRGKSQMKEAQRMAELACSSRLSPWRRGEDEGEGFAVGFEQFRRNYPSPWSSPLVRERRSYPQLCAISCRTGPDDLRTGPRRESRIRFVLLWRVREGHYEHASSSLGVSLRRSTLPSSRRVKRDAGSRRKSEV